MSLPQERFVRARSVVDAVVLRARDVVVLRVVDVLVRSVICCAWLLPCQSALL